MFENAISSSLARTDLLVKVALDEANLKPSDIDHVLLVGGSSRIPAVHRRLEAMFGFSPKASVNVDECVALGAALQAGLTLLRQDPKAVSAGVASGLSDVKLTDVCNHSYGTICAPLDAETGERVVENRIILKKNTALPCEQTQTFYTLYEGQRELTATITQGEDTDPEYVHIIGTKTFELPANRPAQQPVEITYSYDLNQRMHCRFKDVNSGQILEVNFSMDSESPELKKPDA